MGEQGFGGKRAMRIALDDSRMLVTTLTLTLSLSRSAGEGTRGEIAEAASPLP